MLKLVLEIEEYNEEPFHGLHYLIFQRSVERVKYFTDYTRKNGLDTYPFNNDLTFWTYIHRKNNIIVDKIYPELGE
jgi:hypothetical protein